MRIARARLLGASLIVVWPASVLARQELPDPGEVWFAVAVASVPVVSASTPAADFLAGELEDEDLEAQAAEARDSAAAPPTSGAQLARMERELTREDAEDPEPASVLSRAFDGGGKAPGEAIPILMAGIGFLDAPAAVRLPPPAAGAAVRPVPAHVLILRAAAQRVRELRQRLRDAGRWTRDAREVRRFEQDLAFSRAMLRDYAAVLRGANPTALQALLGQAALRATGIRPGSLIPAPDPTALVELARIHAAIGDLNVLRGALGVMRPEERTLAAARLERLLGRLDSSAASLASLAQARAQLFLAGQQLPNGSFPSGWGGSWDNTQMRVPVTSMVLEALHGMDLRQGGRPQAQGLGYIAGNMGLTREELQRQGERFSGNNVEPYALAYSLSAVLEQYEQARPGTAEHAALRAQAEALIGRIASTSWRYSMPTALFPSPPSVATFQLAFLARSLRRAQAAGFALPLRADSETVGAMAAASLAGPQGQLAMGLLGAGATADGGVLGTILQRLASSRDATSGGFPYYTGRPADVADSAFRSPLIEVTLFQTGRSDRTRLRAAVQRFLDHREEFERVILAAGWPGTNQGWHDPAHHHWAPYYYPYAMHGSALALEELSRGGPGDRRFARRVARELLRTLLSQQAPDGTWRPSPHFGAVADTATFATTVAILRRVLGE